MPLEAIKLGDDLGTLEAGKLADIIAVNGDPLQNIACLQEKRNIQLVMKEGRVYADRPIRQEQERRQRKAGRMEDGRLSVTGPRSGERRGWTACRRELSARAKVRTLVQGRGLGGGRRAAQQHPSRVEESDRVRGNEHEASKPSTRTKTAGAIKAAKTSITIA